MEIINYNPMLTLLVLAVCVQMQGCSRGAGDITGEGRAVGGARDVAPQGATAKSGGRACY